jgi:putative toxin-antitoxin system antitoxin component (TIGR02293 family)
MASIVRHMASTTVWNIPYGDNLRLAAMVQAGMPASFLVEMAGRLAISPARLAALVNIAPRTYLRRQTTKSRLKPDETERALRIGRLLHMAREVLEDEEAAARWFSRPLKALGGKPPLELCATEPGAREVEHALGRIEHGVFA